jgi:hypothetical protein
MPPSGGPDRTLVGVARRVGRNHDLDPGERSSARVMLVAHHPAASAMKVSRAYSHRTIVGGIGHNLPPEAQDAYADAEVGGPGT